MRHADAESGKGDDFTRALSDKGKIQAEMMGEWLKNMGLHPMVIVASPYPRAFETAIIVSSTLGVETSVRQDERLAPGMTADSGAQIVQEYGEPGKRLMLVGHSPDLGRLTAHLIGGKNAAIAMSKAAVACLEADNANSGGSTLRWLVNPKMCAKAR